MRKGKIGEMTRLFGSLSVLVGSVFGGGILLGTTSVVLAPGPAGADTPSFTISCNGVPTVGTAAFPTVVTGSIPPSISNGSNFTVSGSQWLVTVPVSLTNAIDSFFGTGAIVTSTVTTTINATGTTQGSESETVSFGATASPSPGNSFLLTGTPSAAPAFTGTGSNVSVTPGVTISAFDIFVNGNPITPFPCTTPTPSPVIAYAQAAIGPFAYVANGGAGTVSVIDTSTNSVVGSPIAVGTTPDYAVVTPNGTDAFVSNNGSDSISEIATGTNHVVATISLTGARGMAMSPDGSTLYVTGGASGDQLYPVDVATQTVGTPVTVGGGAAAVALTPDGTHAFVVDQLDGTVSDVDLATSAVNPIATGLSLPPEVEMSPDGQFAYVDGTGCSGTCGALLPITVSTDSIGTPLDVGPNVDRFAISPDGSTAWVGVNGSGSVAAVDLATQTVTGTYSLGEGGSDSTAAVSVSPNGQTVYVDDTTAGAVVPFDVASLTADPPVSVGTAPDGLAITPDQGPAASLTATTNGITKLDASTSVAGTSPIVSYSWNFGDGSPVTITPTKTTTHQYSTGGTFMATVTETDAAGTSTGQVFAGQTASLNGSSAAEASASVVIVVQGCSPNSTCTAALATTSTPTTPAQSISVKTATPSGAAEVLTVTTGPGALKCSNPTGFRTGGDVTSYAATYTPTVNVHVTDLIQGATSTAGIKVCFQSTTPPPTYLAMCSSSAPPCISKLKVVTGGVKVVLVVPPGDPRYRIEGVATPVELPTGIPTTAVIGQKIKITGTELLGPDGKTVPSAGFTSVVGSVITAPIVSATATAIKVKVPNGAATGPVTLVWPQETAISPKIQIT